MVDAVPMVLQWPGDGAEEAISSMNSSSLISPAASSSRAFHTIVPEPVRSPQCLCLKRLPGQLGAFERHGPLIHDGQGQTFLVRAGGEGQMQVGQITGRGTAGVDDDHLHRGPGGFGGGNALVKHRMAPGEVRSGQHHQIGQFQVLIQPRHSIRPERSLMPHDR